MPLYEYECVECGHLTEVLQRLSEPPLDKCPQCGGPVRKLLSAPAFQFKGSGWYVTDYARKGQSESKTGGEGKGGADKGGGGDGKTSGADKGGGGDGKTSDAADGAAAKSDKKAKPAAGSTSD